MVGAILIALPLAGCGRVGPLSLPPGAAVDQSPNAKQIVGPDGQPVSPQKKDLPIDWLIK